MSLTFIIWEWGDWVPHTMRLLVGFNFWVNILVVFCCDIQQACLCTSCNTWSLKVTWHSYISVELFIELCETLLSHNAMYWGKMHILQFYSMKLTYLCLLRSWTLACWLVLVVEGGAIGCTVSVWCNEWVSTKYFLIWNISDWPNFLLYYWTVFLFTFTFLEQGLYNTAG